MVFVNIIGMMGALSRTGHVSGCVVCDVRGQRQCYLMKLHFLMLVYSATKRLDNRAQGSVNQIVFIVPIWLHSNTGAEVLMSQHPPKHEGYLLQKLYITAQRYLHTHL